MDLDIISYSDTTIDDFVECITAIAANTELKFVKGTAHFTDGVE